MPGEVPESIRFASDPAKLILDAMQGCYHSNLEGVKSSKLNVMKRFIPWLRQLLGVSLEVKTHVKEEALKFAANWKAEPPTNWPPFIIRMSFLALWRLFVTAWRQFIYSPPLDWHMKSLLVYKSVPLKRASACLSARALDLSSLHPKVQLQANLPQGHWLVEDSVAFSLPEVIGGTITICCPFMLRYVAFEF
ncbi:hypothetical protein CsSME_00010963 [Camellia sinensis var. sinensis]